MAMGAQTGGLAFLPAASARPQCHRSRDAVRAEASGQHHAAWSRSTWPLLQHFSPASAQQSFAASQRTSCPWVRAQTQSDGDSLTEHIGGVENALLLSVIGGPCVVSRVCCVPRASPCAVEKSSRSFSCNPEHGLRPLIHEIGYAITPATRWSSDSMLRVPAARLEPCSPLHTLVTASLVFVLAAPLTRGLAYKFVLPAALRARAARRAFFARAEPAATGSGLVGPTS